MYSKTNLYGWSGWTGPEVVALGIPSQGNGAVFGMDVLAIF